MPHDKSGLFGHACGFAASGIRAVRTRLELLSIEIEEEKARIARSLLIAAVGLYLLSCGVLLAVAWIVVSAPAEQRGLVLGLIALLFLLAGGGALLWLRLAAARRKPLFDATVAVLKGDEKALNELRS